MTAKEQRVVIITGSRNVDRLSPAVLEQLLNLGLGPRDVVLHGDCRGIDRLAAQLLRGNTYRPQLIACPAQWAKGASAGPARNRAMAEIARQLECCGYTVEVLAFPAPESRGTRDMIAVAKRHGWEPVVYEVEP